MSVRCVFCGKTVKGSLCQSCISPECECPNCNNGTIGLEQGHLVCRGECGHDFGSVDSETDAITTQVAQANDEAQGQEQPEPRLGDK